jgi:hypothetical protein
LGVGISTLAAGHHCNTTWSMRKWFATSLQISFSYEMDGWNRCGCEAAIAREKDCSRHKGGASAEAEGTEKLKKKWRRRKK